MKQSYLHPVITTNGGATTLPLPKNNSVVKVQQTTTEDFIVTVELNLNDDYVLSLIEEEKAKYFIVVECDDTRYRRSYILDNSTSSTKIAIPRKKVVNKVKVLPYVIVNCALEYQNPYANEYYDGCVFDLAKGDVLVEFKGYKFDAEIIYEFDNIFRVVGNPDPSIKHVVYSLEDKIRIILPHHDFKDFGFVNENKNNIVKIKSSLVINALLYALFMGDLDKDAKETEDNWKKTIRDAVEGDKLPRRFDLKDKSSYPELAQLLLDNVFSTLIQELTNNPNSDSYEAEQI